MAVTKKGEMYDCVRGAKIEFGTFIINPASLAAATEVEETLSFDGLASGDLVFITPRALTTGLHQKGARVTATDVLGVTLRNELTTSVDGGEITYQYMVVKFGGDA